MGHRTIQGSPCVWLSHSLASTPMCLAHTLCISILKYPQFSILIILFVLLDFIYASSFPLIALLPPSMLPSVEQANNYSFFSDLTLDSIMCHPLPTKKQLIIDSFGLPLCNTEDLILTFIKTLSNWYLTSLPPHSKHGCFFPCFHYQAKGLIVECILWFS